MANNDDMKKGTYADGLVLQCSKCGNLAAVPDDTPPGSSVVCPECTKKLMAGDDDMKTGTVIAWCVISLITFTSAIALWYYAHRLFHWFEATQ